MSREQGSRKQASGGQHDDPVAVVPHVIEIDAEVRPIDAFHAVAYLPHPFFLDGGGGQAMPDGIAEFSIVGADPFATIIAKNSTMTVRGLLPPGRDSQPAADDPFGALGHVIDFNRLAPVPGLPFCGGAVGYLGYDLCHSVERLPRTVARDVRMPDMFFGLYDVAAVFDHRRGRAFVVSNGLPEHGEAAFVHARRRAEWLAELLSARQLSNSHPGPASTLNQPWPVGSPNVPISNFTKTDYLRAVRRAREYIFAGDIYQVNLSQRLEVDFRADPIALYESLRAISPAPFGAYIDPGPIRILSNSPERFLRRAGARVETRPIKGTRPRSQDPAADRAMAAELLASEKDAAEHLMIVDLERNDLGKVCEYGSVVVEELARLESYRTVHHLVSIVEGELRPGAGTADLLRATFPGGSITGAPKVRAMEIIDELEPAARGIYTGAIGYLSFCGAIDLAIAIRTLVHDGVKAYFQVGGGIVADSDPAAEYEETLDKAQAFLKLLATMNREVLRT